MTLGSAASTIVIRITGDTKQLQTAVAGANRTLGSLGTTKGLAIGAGIGIATAAVVDFGGKAVAEADRVGDALTRLETQLGERLTAGIDDAADEMHELGQSRQDVLELSATFTDLATALGASDAAIAKFAPDAAETAAAIALITDQDAASVIEAIGKAADGNKRSLRELGINLTDAEIEARALANTGKDSADALTDADIAAAGYELVLEKLEPRLKAVADGNRDVETSAATLEAKFETLTGKIGEAVEGPLSDFLDWTLNGVSGLEDLIGLLEKSPAFLDVFGDAFEKLTKGPLDAALDTLHGILSAIGIINNTPVTVQYSSTPNPDRNDGRGESATLKEIRDYAARNGLTIL